MQEQQQKELKDLIENTHTKVDEINLKIDNKLDEILDNLTNISPETSTVVSDNLNLIKNETINVKTKVNNIETDTTNIKTKVNNINDNTTNVLEKTEQVLTNSNIVLTNSNEIKSELENISNDNTIIKNDITYIKTNVNSLISNAENLVFNTNNISASLNNVVNNESEMISKLDSLIENQGNSSGENTSVDLSEVEENLNTINNSVSEINTNVTDIASDVTTINSNVATTKNNVNTINTNVNTINSNIDTLNKNVTKEYNNRLTQKLDEIIRLLKKENNDTFSEDPYKLDLPYSGKIETHRNPTNTDVMLVNGDFTSQKILFCLADCEDDTFSFKYTVNFTCDKTTTIGFHATNNYRQTISYEAGTHTCVITDENLIVTDNKISIFTSSYPKVTVHQATLELYANNVIIVPKHNKYNVRCGTDKVGISKVENNNAYYLDIPYSQLYPNALQQTYTLEEEKVRKYDFIYDAISLYNNYTSTGKLSTFVLNDFTYKYKMQDNYRTQIYSANYAIDCASGYYDFNNRNSALLLIQNNYDVYLGLAKNSSGTFSPTKIDFLKTELCGVTMAKRINNFNSTEMNVYILTTVKGINHIYISSTSNLEIGYGKNVTAFIYKDDSWKLSVYMNDGGYCVKRVYQIYEDKSTPTLLSEKIIGTYDAFFETNSDVYLVEKNNHLYMFKNNFNTSDGIIE